MKGRSPSEKHNIHTMNVRVELIYRAVPPEAELKTIQQAGHYLTNNSKSVSVRLVETAESCVIILEFSMKTQAQYKVVDKISDEVQRWLLSDLYDDIVIRFG